MHMVAPGVYQVSLPRRGVAVNAYLLLGPDGLGLVDTGVPGSWPRLARAIHTLGREPGELRTVALTHHHVDHMGSLAAIRAQTGASVYAHALEAPLLEGSDFRPAKASRSLSGRLRTWASHQLNTQHAEPARVDNRLGDGDNVPGSGLHAIHTPGHTAGHLAFLHRSGVLLIGDAAANVWGRLSGPIGDHDEDREAMVASLRRLAALEYDTLCFGHGRAIRDNPRGRLERLARQLGG